MNKNKTETNNVKSPVITGAVLLIFWLSFSVFFFGDFYLSMYDTGETLKSLAYMALVMNVITLICSTFLFIKKKMTGKLYTLAVALNILPILGILSIVFWWLFIFKM